MIEVKATGAVARCGVSRLVWLPLAAFLAWVPATPAIAQNGPQSVAPVAEKLLDAVVNISTTQTLKGPQGIPLPKVPEGSPFEEFFKEFFDRRGDGQEDRRVSSLGSGFVIDPSGLVVTNNHVIADADEIIINFNDGTKLKVEKILGRDTKTDLALLKVNPTKPLKAVGFGDASKLRVGDWVMAIGNPFGLGGSVTVGIISAKKRDINSGPYDDFLQTDAAINKGNSGGPLFNMDGEVIGINTAIISPTGGSIGLGFAVPSNEAVGVIDQLKLYGETRRGWIGVNIQSVTDEIAESLGMIGTGGALVSQVAPEGPAAKGGLEAGDVIIRFDGKDVPDMRALPKIVALTAIGKEIEVEVLRNGQAKILKLKVERLTEDSQPASTTPVPEGGGNLVPEGLGPVSVMGLKLQPMSDELRQKYSIADNVQGIIITDVEATSDAAAKGLQAGEIIVEVTNQQVTTPAEFSERIAAIQAAGRKSALLLVATPTGEIRFVAVPVGAQE